MARLDQGLLGGFSGKLGTTVGASWKGINVVRTYQPTVANPNTQKQKAQRTIFGDWAQLASFILSDFIKPLWDRKAKKMSGYNAFIQANLNHPSASGAIDPAIMILSTGNMGVTNMIAAAFDGAGGFGAEWDGSEMPLYGSPDDVLFGLLFNYEGELLAKTSGEFTRGDSNVAIKTPALAGVTEAVFVSCFMSADGKVQSVTNRFGISG